MPLILDNVHYSVGEPMKIMDCRIQDLERYTAKNWVLATANSKLYISMKKGDISLHDLKQMDPSRWTDQPCCISPLRDGESLSAVYKKVHEPLAIVCSSSNGLRKITDDDILKRITEREIIACEYIRRFPAHPNIAKYRGVSCKSAITCRSSSGNLKADFDTERVTGIVFKRYTSSLMDHVRSGKPVSLTYCLESIVNGIKHMHSIGLVHCDIKPDNIFVDDTGRRCEYVIGDFDSTAQTGSVYELKGGDLNWSKGKRFHADKVEEDDDWYAFEATKAWLVRKLNRQARDYAHIGGPKRVRRP